MNTMPTEDYRLVGEDVKELQRLHAYSVPNAREFLRVRWVSLTTSITEEAPDMSYPKAVITETRMDPPASDAEHVGWTTDYRLATHAGSSDVILQRLRLVQADGGLPTEEWVSLPTVTLP